MLYLKINEKIKHLIDLVNIKIGCKYYCKYQIIALDEFELLKKEIELKKLQIITEEEYKLIVKSTECCYFHSTHVCSASVDEANAGHPESDTEMNEEELLKELKSDKIAESNKKNKYFDLSYVDYNDSESVRKQKDDEENKKNHSSISKIKNENSISYAFSLIVSFFLLTLGAYYLGRFLEMKDSNIYKLILVISIVTLIAEMVLIIIKFHKDEEKNLTYKDIKNQSFAYRFNKKYRDRCTNKYNYSANKTHPKAE